MDVKSLERENRRLRQEIEACRAQERLFESLLTLLRSASEKEALAHTMQQTLEMTARVSGAKAGSLFLLDEAGRVGEAILTRGQVGARMKAHLVGSVLDKGLAGWVRSCGKAGLVTDTQTDPRWLSFPDQPYAVRSALAVPIVKQDALFGILTLMHPEPDFFTQEAVARVQETAGHLAVAIEGAKLYVRLEELNRERQKALQRDLALARQVQESFLPTRMPRVPGYGFSAMSRAAQVVGGDFYAFYHLQDRHLGVALGDVSGKGIAASLFMARLSSDLAHYAPVYREPGQLVAKINQALCQRSPQGMFATLIYLMVDLDSGLMRYANAGHLPPVLIRAADGVMTCDGKGKGPPLGVLADAAYGQESVCLDPGDKVVLVTDGVTEARDKAGNLLGLSGLASLLRDLASLSPKALVKKLVRSVDLISEKNERKDDLTLVCVERERPKPG